MRCKIFDKFHVCPFIKKWFFLQTCENCEYQDNLGRKLNILKMFNVYPRHHIMVKSFSQLPHQPMKGPIPHDMELLPRTAQPAFNSWGLPLRQITVTLYHCVCWQNKLFILSCLDILANSCIFYALLLDFVWLGCIGIGIRFGWSFHNNFI